MKKIILIAVIFGLMTVGTFAVPQSPKSVKDMRDFLLQPPNNIYKNYGYSENTLFLFNIARLIEICRNYEMRIVVLEKRVADEDRIREMESRSVCDVNAPPILEEVLKD